MKQFSKQQVGKQILVTVSVIFLLSLLLLGCISYLRDIPVFPEVKILEFHMASHVLVGEKLEWAVFVNTCTDCVRVTTYSKVELTT